MPPRIPRIGGVRRAGEAPPPRDVPAGGATVTGIEAARAARMRSSPQDVAKMFGPNSEGTLPMFDVRDLNNVRKADRGLEGANTVMLFDVEEFRSIRNNGLKRSDVWDEESLADFNQRAEWVSQGYDLEEMAEIPSFEARIIQETGDIHILTNDWYDEAIEAAVSYVELTGGTGTKIPMQLMWDEPLSATLRHVKGLTGRVEIRDAQTREVLRVTTLRELEMPNARELRAYIDPVAEKMDLEAQGRITREMDETDFSGGRTLRAPGGRITLMPRGGNTMQVVDVIVDEADRGRGIGTKLYNAALKEAEAEGRRLVSDTTVSADAVRRWEALGHKYHVRQNDATWSADGRLVSDNSAVPVFEMLSGEEIPAMMRRQAGGLGKAPERIVGAEEGDSLFLKPQAE